jgi:cell fate regulator YaaT (PSP1 superfamily)
LTAVKRQSIAYPSFGCYAKLLDVSGLTFILFSIGMSMDSEIQATRPATVAGVRFSKVGKLYHFDYSQYPSLQSGDFVIVETARGRQMGQIMGFIAPDASEGREYRPILRPATPRDLVLKQQWELKQDEALDVCRDKAQRIGGLENAKFVAAQYNYDGSMLTFIFTAEDKVNTGKLWNELSRAFPAQVELRQVGPRDVAKLLGGYGACGELRCCSTFLTDFSPISIKMAKVQGISLNPSEITGMCGRLRCCLVYEYEQYVEARQHLPKKNKRVGTPHGEGKVIDVHPLQDAVTVMTEEGFHMVKREDIVPLEELRALEKKAKEPCTKHGDEPCECGAKPGNRRQDAADAEAEEEE